MTGSTRSARRPRAHPGDGRSGRADVEGAGQAEQYGLDVAKLPEIFRQNFIDDIQDQILQLKDPTQYALKQLEIEKAAAIAQATARRRYQFGRRALWAEAPGDRRAGPAGRQQQLPGLLQRAADR
jgi:hypothetical protein